MYVQYKKVCQTSHNGPNAPAAQVLLKHLRHKWDQRFSHAAQEVKVRLYPSVARSSSSSSSR